jgi:hypothetical protein
MLIVFFGCGGGGSSSSSSVVDTEQIGDKYIKIFTVANKAVSVDFQREEFDFDKYADLSEYVNSLKNSIICESGSISFNIVSESDNCGVYEVQADNCYINGKLIYDGIGKISSINISNIRCYVDEIDTETNVTVIKNILGNEKKFTYLKGFVKTYSGDSTYQYNITGNGQVMVDGEIYNLDNFNVYISSHYDFVYNVGDIGDSEYSLHFTDLGDDTTVWDNDVVDSGYEIFTVNSKYYGIINDSNNKVYVHDLNDVKISNDYDFLKIYDVYYND